MSLPHTKPPKSKFTPLHLPGAKPWKSLKQRRERRKLLKLMYAIRDKTAT